MILFLVVLLLLAAALETYTLYDGFRHIDFSYGPDVLRTEPDAPFHTQIRITNTGILPVSYVRTRVRLPHSLSIPDGYDTEDSYAGLRPSSLAGRMLPGQKEADERFFLWGRRRVTRNVESHIARRGVHLFDSARLIRGDFLGLKEIAKDVYGMTSILVYPKRLDNPGLNDHLGSFLGDLSAKRYLIRDPILTAGVREYTGYEPMHTISWSQTARRGELMVREFDYTRDLSCGVILCVTGLGPLEYDRLDTCCSLARSVCETLMQHSVAIHFYTNASLYGYTSRDVFTCEASSANEDALLEALARVQNAPTCSAEQLADASLQAEGGDAAFVVIAPYHNIHADAVMDIIRQETRMDPVLLAGSDYEPEASVQSEQ